jgi:hypothetical protein
MPKRLLPLLCILPLLVFMSTGALAEPPRSPSLNNTPGLVVPPVSTDAQLSQTEIDALRERIRDCWSPPPGIDANSDIYVSLRVLFRPDGSLAQMPVVVAESKSPLGPALADSGVHALLMCQPFTMLKPEHYALWKDITVDFNPRDLGRRAKQDFERHPPGRVILILENNIYSMIFLLPFAALGLLTGYLALRRGLSRLSTLIFVLLCIEASIFGATALFVATVITEALIGVQGCSTLITESHGKDGFKAAERCGVAVLGDRVGLVDPQDIVGEAAHSREDAGIFSDARRVFT